MRLLVFGDVHGNLIALEKMLSIEKNQVDGYICHGDIVNYGPFSEQCLDLISILPHCEMLKGNHEECFLKGVYLGEHPVAKAFFEFCFPLFNKNKLSLLRPLNDSIEVFGNIIQHTIGHRYLFEDTPLDDIIIKKPHIIGHSHQQYERYCNGHRLINTGSLGQNRTIINKSEYVIFDTDNNSVQFKSFVFPFDKLIKEMKNLKYPEVCLNYYVSKPKITV